MSNATQTGVIIGAVAVLIGLQSFWLARHLNARFRAVADRLDHIEKRVNDTAATLIRQAAEAIGHAEQQPGGRLTNSR